MEEIYKPDADGPEKVEVYSRENNDMLGDMPEWLIHTGSYIVYRRAARVRTRDTARRIL